MKTKMNLNNLKPLSRQEMKAIKGGDAVFCTSCSGLDSATCYAKYCQSQYCWIYNDGSSTYLCQCNGDCGGGGTANPSKVGGA